MPLNKASNYEDHRPNGGKQANQAEKVKSAKAKLKTGTKTEKKKA